MSPRNGCEHTLKKVYILLLNWNGWRDSIECLESIFRNEHSNYQVILCDNDSRDGSLEHVKAWADRHMDVAVALDNPLHHISFPPIPKPIVYAQYNRQQAEAGGCPASRDAQLILIQTGSNLGFAGGNNVGLRYALSRADFSYIWLLNNDTVILPNTLTRLLSRAKQDSNIGICGSSLRYYYAPNQYQCFGGASYNKWLGTVRLVGGGMQVGEEIECNQVETAMDYVMGASMLVSFEFLQTVGLMEEGYFLYFEELDWAVRCKGKFLIAYAPNSIVFHKEGASIGTKNSTSRSKRFLSEYYFTRNKLVFTKKHYPYALPTLYFGILIAVFVRLLRGQLSRAITLIKVLLKIVFKAQI